MSVRQTRCPKCDSADVEVLQELDPETTGMNMRVLLKCISAACGHEWEGRVMSHYTRRQIGRGLRV